MVTAREPHQNANAWLASANRDALRVTLPPPKISPDPDATSMMQVAEFVIGRAKCFLSNLNWGACTGRLADVGEAQTGWGISIDSMANSKMDAQVRMVDRPLHPSVEGCFGGLRRGLGLGEGRDQLKG